MNIKQPNVNLIKCEINEPCATATLTLPYKMPWEVKNCPRELEGDIEFEADGWRSLGITLLMAAAYFISGLFQKR